MSPKQPQARTQYSASPELGIVLDTPRVIFLLCLIALLLTFADYTAKVKRTRRVRRR
ncbi:hypothetical protein [Rothia mucilaginosa]